MLSEASALYCYDYNSLAEMPGNLAKTSMIFANAFLFRNDSDKQIIKDLLHPSNKLTRNAFIKWTNIENTGKKLTLPRSVKEISAIVEQFCVKIRAANIK